MPGRCTSPAGGSFGAFILPAPGRWESSQLVRITYRSNLAHSYADGASALGPFRTRMHVHGGPATAATERFSQNVRSLMPPISKLYDPFMQCHRRHCALLWHPQALHIPRMSRTRLCAVEEREYSASAVYQEHKYCPPEEPFHRDCKRVP